MRRRPAVRSNAAQALPKAVPRSYQVGVGINLRQTTPTGNRNFDKPWLMAAGRVKIGLFEFPSWD
jgi:hypothetical protein